MRVLYIVHSVNMSEGATKSFLTLLDGLAKRGVEPHVITPGKQGLYVALHRKGIVVMALNYRPGVFPNFNSMKDRLLFLPRLMARRFLEHRAIRAIVGYCKHNGIELIHTNVSVVTCGLAAATKLKIPHVLHAREYADLDFNLHYYPSPTAFYKRVNVENSYTICITKGIQRHHHFLPSCSRVIYNGVVIDSVSSVPSSMPDMRNPYFLFVGRIEQSKGVSQVVEAFNQYCKERTDKNVVLKIAGEITQKAYYDEVSSFVRECGIQGKVEFMGDRRDIDSLMQHALAVIVASPSEAFGRCLPEAMLNHCLTIGRNAAGTKEQYDNGLAVCGSDIGLRYGTSQELTLRMLEVTDTPPMAYAEMKDNAFRVVQQLYSKDAYVDGVFSFYQEIQSKCSRTTTSSINYD